MYTYINIVFVYLIISIISWKTVHCINCYQCSGTDSENPFECNEFLDSDVSLKPTDCATIHEARYCIKHVGRFEGTAIECYQCNTSTTMECSDGLMTLDSGILKPTPCDHVFNARYCIKHSGGIGTKRYCSSLDLGTYCNYVQQPGDKLEYRSCIYTCNSDGCNSGYGLRISGILLVISLFLRHIVF